MIWMIEIQNPVLKTRIAILFWVGNSMVGMSSMETSTFELNFQTFLTLHKPRDSLIGYMKWSRFFITRRFQIV